MRVGTKIVRQLRRKATGEIVDRFEFTTKESAAFEYRNHTMVVLTREHGPREYFDTRYFCGNEEEFVKNYEENYINTAEYVLEA